MNNLMLYISHLDPAPIMFLVIDATVQPFTIHQNFFETTYPKRRNDHVLLESLVANWSTRLSTAHLYTNVHDRVRVPTSYDGHSSVPGDAPLTTLVTSSPEANSTVELFETLYAGQEKVDPSPSCA